MCLILFGKIEDVRKLDLQMAWSRNDDGAGIVILGRPARAIRGLMKYKHFIKTIKRIPRGAQVAIHVRKATHGASSAEWTHPFECGDECWLMHNGILTALGERGPQGKSDSAHLADILSYLPLDHKISLLEQIANGTGKFLLIRRDTFRKFGFWESHENVSMSNNLLVPHTPYVYNGNVNPTNLIGFRSNKSVYKNGKWDDHIVEESKPVIQLPPINGSNHYATDVAAAPFRKSELEELFQEDGRDPEFERFLAHRRWYGD